MKMKSKKKQPVYKKYQNFIKYLALILITLSSVIAPSPYDPGGGKADAALIEGSIFDHQETSNDSGTTIDNPFLLDGQDKEVNFKLSGKSFVEGSFAVKDKKILELKVPPLLIGNVELNGPITVNAKVMPGLTDNILIKGFVSAISALISGLGAAVGGVAEAMGVELHLDEINEKLNLVTEYSKLFNREIQLNGAKISDDGSTLTVPYDTSLGTMLSNGLNDILTDVETFFQNYKVTGSNKLLVPIANAALNGTFLTPGLRQPIIAAIKAMKPLVSALGYGGSQFANIKLGDGTEFNIPLKIKDPSPEQLEEFSESDPNSGSTEATFSMYTTKDDFINLDPFGNKETLTSIYYESIPYPTELSWNHDKSQKKLSDKKDMLELINGYNQTFYWRNISYNKNYKYIVKKKTTEGLVDVSQIGPISTGSYDKNKPFIPQQLTIPKKWISYGENIYTVEAWRVDNNGALLNNAADDSIELTLEATGNVVLTKCPPILKWTERESSKTIGILNRDEGNDMTVEVLDSQDPNTSDWSVTATATVVDEKKKPDFKLIWKDNAEDTTTKPLDSSVVVFTRPHDNDSNNKIGTFSKSWNTSSGVLLDNPTRLLAGDYSGLIEVQWNLKQVMGAE